MWPLLLEFTGIIIDGDNCGEESSSFLAIFIPDIDTCGVAECRVLDRVINVLYLTSPPQVVNSPLISEIIFSLAKQ
jgi:hypothetical protein